MKRIIYMITSFIIVISISIVSNKIFGAMEIKAGTKNFCNVTVSQSYQICLDLKDSTSTLGANTLDPHLIKNSEWGAVAYLQHSRYGANGNNVTTTTGNSSGVYNLNGYTQTASLFENRNNKSTVEINSNASVNGIWKLNLEVGTENVSTKYIDVLPALPNKENTAGMAIAETAGWYGATQGYVNANSPVQIRDSLFGSSYNINYGSGGANSNVTFRPVIWN